jgi:HEAT repeat protein
MSFAHALSLALALPLAGVAVAQDKKETAGIQPGGLKNLRHADANVRLRTAALIAKQGPQAKYAIAELRLALDDADPLVRVVVAEAIWKVERPTPSAIMPTLQRGLKDRNAAVRAAACRVIGLLGAKGKSAVPTLIDTLKDKDLLVAMNAVVALGNIGPPARAAAPALLQLAAYTEFSVLEPFVSTALSDMGDAVVPELRAALKEASFERRRVAAAALGGMGTKAEGAVQGLATALRDKEWTVRSLAAQALGNIGKGAKASLPRLYEAADDKETLVRIQAALAVWRIGGETKYVAMLSNALTDASIPVRQAACRALGAMGADAKDAAGALTRTLADNEAILRQWAAEALGNIGPAAKDSAAALRTALKDTDKPVRLSAAFALWQVTGAAKEAREALQAFLSDDGVLQTRAVDRLGDIGPAARAALPELVTMYREEDDEALHRTLAVAIKKIDPTLAGKLGIR